MLSFLVFIVTLQVRIARTRCFTTTRSSRTEPPMSLSALDGTNVGEPDPRRTVEISGDTQVGPGVDHG